MRPAMTRRTTGVLRWSYGGRRQRPSADVIGPAQRVLESSERLACQSGAAGGPGSDIPWCGASSGGGVELGPGGVLVVAGLALEAAVQDADEPVGQLAEGGA